MGKCWRVGDGGRKGREGGDRDRGWGEKRSEVKADVNTNAKFLVMVTWDMTQKFKSGLFLICCIFYFQGQIS